MKFRIKYFLLAIIVVLGQEATAQRNQNIVKEKINPLLCDPTSGVCEMPAVGNEPLTNAPAAKEKPIRIVYFTDPICSSCWGIEPQLRKLKLEYGDSVEFEYRMGGLLPDWSYNSGGISKPSDVAHHWDEVSLYYRMPIDGDVWLEDPLPSSYPPSIAFKAAEMQSSGKALVFLRRLREMVFLEKKNITRLEFIKEAAQYAKLDINRLVSDYTDGDAKKWFEKDLALARSMGVRGFPTVYVTDQNKSQIRVYGSRPYEEYENAILALVPNLKKKTHTENAEAIFDIYPTLCLREMVELTNISQDQAEKILAGMVQKGTLDVLKTKNGNIWRRK